MANNCLNTIKITGENTKKIITLLNKTKENESIFYTLIKAGSDLTIETGQKWDVSISQATSQTHKGKQEDGSLLLIFDTAWSPCLVFSQELSRRFLVKVDHIYEESGNNFAGRWVYENGEILSDEEYGYLEGAYKWGNLIDEIVETYEINSLTGFNEFVEDGSLSFLTDEQLGKVKEEFMGKLQDNKLESIYNLHVKTRYKELGLETKRNLKEFINDYGCPALAAQMVVVIGREKLYTLLSDEVEDIIIGENEGMESVLEQALTDMIENY